MHACIIVVFSERIYVLGWAAGEAMVCLELYVHQCSLTYFLPVIHIILGLHGVAYSLILQELTWAKTLSWSLADYLITCMCNNTCGHRYISRHLIPSMITYRLVSTFETSLPAFEDRLLARA